MGAGLILTGLLRGRPPYRPVPPSGAGILSFVLPKESSQRKGAPGSASLLRSDSLRYSVPAGAAELVADKAWLLRQSSPLFRRLLRCSAPRRALNVKTIAATPPAAPTLRDGFLVLTFTPSEPPSSAVLRGAVGEHCLRGVAPSCAAAPGYEQHREVVAASSQRPAKQGRLFFGDFLLAKQKKVTRPAGRNQTPATSTHMDQTP